MGFRVSISVLAFLGSTTSLWAIGGPAFQEELRAFHALRNTSQNQNIRVSDVLDKKRKQEEKKKQEAEAKKPQRKVSLPIRISSAPKRASVRSASPQVASPQDGLAAVAFPLLPPPPPLPPQQTAQKVHTEEEIQQAKMQALGAMASLGSVVAETAKRRVFLREMKKDYPEDVVNLKDKIQQQLKRPRVASKSLKDRLREENSHTIVYADSYKRLPGEGDLKEFMAAHSRFQGDDFGAGAMPFVQAQWDQESYRRRIQDTSDQYLMKTWFQEIHNVLTQMPDHHKDCEMKSLILGAQIKGVNQEIVSFINQVVDTPYDGKYERLLQYIEEALSQEGWKDTDRYGFIYRPSISWASVEEEVEEEKPDVQAVDSPFLGIPIPANQGGQQGKKTWWQTIFG